MRAAESAGQRLLDELISEMRARYPAVGSETVGDGIGWSSCELSSDRDVAGEARSRYPQAVAAGESPIPVALNVITRPDFVKSAVVRGIDEDGPAALMSCDALVEITTSGYLLDWMIVRTVHNLAVDRWEAILYTEAAGFDTSRP